VEEELDIKRSDSAMVISKLPRQPTSFIGREAEIAEIVSLLADPNCRLLTLIGHGGIGKTRLAIEVATQNMSAFSDGVCFVDLQPVSTIEYIVAAIADSIDIPLYGQDDPHVHLLRYLRDKHMLLVMDNFEHLLNGVNLLIEILDTAPSIKLLVTSRETLNISAEWLRRIQGLRFPATDEQPNAQTCDAVQLFARRAYQLRADFSLDRELPHVVRICQLVEGMPLALELAANWLKTLNCELVAREIERSLDILSTTLRDIPDRHRSMWAVFEPTWNHLTDAERSAFMRLSVFQGSFSREAAEQMAETTLVTLSSLVDKSLLRTTSTGRYAMHELVRQYGEEQLKELPDEWEHVQDQHCAYYTAFLHRQEAALKEPNQLDALDQIVDEIDNVRAAWRWASLHQRVNDLVQALDGLGLYFEMRALHWEARDAFGLALQHVDDQLSGVRGRLLIWQGHNMSHVNRLLSEQLLQQGIAMLQELGVADSVSFPLYTLAWSEKAISRDVVKHLCLKNLAGFRRVGNSWAVANTLNALGAVSLGDGEYEMADAYFQESLAVFQADGNQWGIATSYGGLQVVAWLQGHHAAVRRYAEKHREICQATGDKLGVAYAQTYLGGVAYMEGDYAEARRLFEQNLNISDAYHMHFDVGHLERLAMVAHIQGDLALCRQYLYNGWHIALNEDLGSEYRPALLIHSARLRIAEGKPERAVELISAALSDWAALKPRFWKASPSWSRLGKPPEDLLAELEAELSPNVFAAAKCRGERADLDEVIAAVVADLAESVTQDDSTSVPVITLAHESNQQLVDPLSQRELEVLVLIAGGLTNRQIAGQLYIGVSTVKKHINHIYSKLDVTHRAQAVARARTLNILS
jgi:predicted ATPase/DNA-binding CsgD family transcriptional regulator